MGNDDRYRGDGSADMERILRARAEAESPAPQVPHKEPDRRYEAVVGICATQTTLRTIVGFRAAAQHAPDHERYYRAMWRALRNMQGGDRVRFALLRAAALDGVRLEAEEA